MTDKELLEEVLKRIAEKQTEARVINAQRSDKLKQINSAIHSDVYQNFINTSAYVEDDSRQLLLQEVTEDNFEIFRKEFDNLKDKVSGAVKEIYEKYSNI